MSCDSWEEVGECVKREKLEIAQTRTISLIHRKTKVWHMGKMGQ